MESIHFQPLVTSVTLSCDTGMTKQAKKPVTISSSGNTMPESSEPDQGTRRMTSSGGRLRSRLGISAG